MLPYLSSSGGMWGVGEGARAGVGEGGSVSVSLVSWEAVMRLVDHVTAASSGHSF